MNAIDALPGWQLDTIYPGGLDGEAFTGARARLAEDLEALSELMDRRDVRRNPEGEPAAAGSPSLISLVEDLIERFDALLTLHADIGAFLTGFTATDAFDDRAQAIRSSLSRTHSRLVTLERRFEAWLGGIDLEAVTARSDLAAAHGYMLNRAAISGEHLMTDEAEALAAALDASSGVAWARLHGNLVSRSTVRRAFPGHPDAEYVLAELKHLQADPSAEVRRAAFEAELDLLGRHDLSYAAAMNGVKGQVDELARRRGWSNPLDQSLFQNGIDAASLDAMHTAVRESLPVFRRYLFAKAELLGVGALRWYDLQAPVVASTHRFDWNEATAFVADAFRDYSPALARFAEEAVENGWIDAPPRKGKRNGAFCTAVPGRRESRILLNFSGSLDGVFTLAHELGHAYHNRCKYLAGRGYLQGRTPMTLAETASIFCETVVLTSMLGRATPEGRLAILEQDLLGTTQLVVDIHARFLFESRVFEKRRDRELSVDELRGLMLDAQAETYGEALAEDGRHPLMWAHKGHYYSAGLSFYNYPYTFGYLFGLGLHAHYRDHPDGFQERYDELLASTGTTDAATLAQRFGIDIHDPGFWRTSLDVARERVAAYEALAAERA